MLEWFYSERLSQAFVQCGDWIFKRLVDLVGGDTLYDGGVIGNSKLLCIVAIFQSHYAHSVLCPFMRFVSVSRQRFLCRE
ncbi:MAG TPA: hypothetical protein VGL91_24750 [Acidobacteriota bacterium]